MSTHFIATEVFALSFCFLGSLINGLLLLRIYRNPMIRKTLHDFCINSLVFWSFLSCLVLGINSIGISVVGGVSNNFFVCQISGSFMALCFGNQLASHAVLALDRYLAIVFGGSLMGKRRKLMIVLFLFLQMGILATIAGTLFSAKKY